MADGQNEDVEMMEEDGWEYYDDNDVLTDFWQVRLLTGQTFTITTFGFPPGLHHERNGLCSSIGQLDETLHEAVREWLRVLHVPRVLAGVGAAAAGPQARHHLGGPAHRQGGGQSQGGAAAGEDFFVSTIYITLYSFLTFLQPLEQFICGTEDVASVWRQLSECDAPPAVCGHVFRHGETCYNCK